MRIKFWGVRGSIPHSLDSAGWTQHFEKVMKDFFQKGYNKAEEIQSYIRSKAVTELGGFGTATTCVEVKSENQQSIIVDGGSGIKSLSDEIIKQGRLKEGLEIHILLTHFHFDHIMGLPFFIPHFTAGCKIHYYSVQPEAESVVKSLFQKPTFPVSYGSLSATIEFHKLEAYKENKVNGFTITPYQTDHPDLCYGFKITDGKKTYAHAVDNEASRITKADLAADAGLYEGVDLVYFDSQYDEDTFANKKGWGHGTSHRGFEICANFNIQQILFAHHDPAFSIEDSLAQQKKTELNFTNKYSHLDVKWQYAYDGLEITL